MVHGAGFSALVALVEAAEPEQASPLSLASSTADGPRYGSVGLMHGLMLR